MTGKISVELTTTLNCVDADKTVIWSLCRHRECWSIQYCHESKPGNIFKLTAAASLQSNQRHCGIQQEAKHRTEMIIQRHSKRERKNWQNEGLNHLFMLVKFLKEVAVVRTQHYFDDFTLIWVPESLSVDWKLKLCLIAAHFNQNDPRPLSILIVRVITYWLMSFQRLHTTGGFKLIFSRCKSNPKVVSNAVTAEGWLVLPVISVH